MIAEREETGGESHRIDCPVLVTDRLVMRPPHEDDVTELAELANDRRVADMLSRLPHPYTVGDAEAFVNSIRENAWNGCAYALTLAETGAFIGCAGLDSKAGGLELGYWIGHKYWGRGYATEAAHALVDLAFRATEIDKLHVACRVINPASRRVIHKCGFQYAGQGMMDSVAVGKVPVERYQLDRKTWVSLRTWGSA
ncbi:RimJ/RimL family protein N-acetyltransferase [Mesorhizobium sp. J18]|uniref:GNAT family N-acetyltransferase n=1 Tax=Mesorhizobium sp. J18 TaxID=935263 RepID=UPI001198DE64|nr:GNAT family N-acetyltransferase [Mesorhizobium sp. J18]TWG98982.1 RimJ/RimL family protein N-acetyltransferase [Mesorhizobium sp. J18]